LRFLPRFAFLGFFGVPETVVRPLVLVYLLFIPGVILDGPALDLQRFIFSVIPAIRVFSFCLPYERILRPETSDLPLSLAPPLIVNGVKGPASETLSHFFSLFSTESFLPLASSFCLRVYGVPRAESMNIRPVSSSCRAVRLRVFKCNREALLLCRPHPPFPPFSSDSGTFFRHSGSRLVEIVRVIRRSFYFSPFSDWRARCFFSLTVFLGPGAANTVVHLPSSSFFSS